jgi:hypothetical protein
MKNVRKVIVAIGFVFFSLVSKADYLKATIILVDGNTRTGLVDSDLSEVVMFKVSENADVEQIKSSTIKSVSMQKGSVLSKFCYLKVYEGLSQKRVSRDAIWLKVVEKGAATLFMHSSAQGSSSKEFIEYYACREGEPAAKLIGQVSAINENQIFWAKAPLYFEDYPKLAAKIVSKKYTSKDVVHVVQEYNEWAMKKKG